MIAPQHHDATAGQDGTLDGLGAGDHDQPLRFGWRPRASVPFPFSTRQYARLLVLRSRFQAGLVGRDDVALAETPARQTIEA
jgi:hypothetical protein